MATVDLIGLTKRFGKGPPAVDGVTLHLDHGELVALLGPSGCGKTTTLRTIAGFLQPDAGEIRVDGKVIASPRVTVPPEQRNMSMIFQSYAIWPHKTVGENVAYGLKFRQVSRADAAAKVRKMLAVVRLERLVDRYPAELSGGQQQRVALARALVVEPAILLLDEPLSNLDANLREEMRFEIRRLHDEFQITSVYVTHDQAEAMVIADRICVMNLGRIEQVGTPDEIYDRPRTEFSAQFIGKTNLLRGRLDGEGRLILSGGLLLPVHRNGGSPVEGEVAVSLRPHLVQLRRSEEDAARLLRQGYRAFPARITQRFYFGDSIDYQVELGADTALRVIAPANERYAVNEAVVALIHPNHAVVVSAP
ncbi:MAG: ABC transporter ATP-binding protein [Candidatus Lambdaproteobacteria bacterium]|nr:ABC transporter ATP-binding protein [Candidatus Lambdaproteobacteria bacterium]